MNPNDSKAFAVAVDALVIPGFSTSVVFPVPRGLQGTCRTIAWVRSAQLVDLYRTTLSSSEIFWFTVTRFQRGGPNLYGMEDAFLRRLY